MRFVAWLPKAEHEFIKSIVDVFGRPTEPIVLRSRSTIPHACTCNKEE
jgi:hypothetical protein